MKYNKLKIADRIIAERKKKKWTQTDLINELSEKGIKVGRNTISRIESATHDFSNFNLDLLIALSELFECEVGYLLCEYDCPTGRNTDISKETGLNNNAINTLMQLNKNQNAKRLLDTLNLIMGDNIPFTYFLDHLCNYFNNIYDTPLHYDIKERNYKESLSNAPMIRLADKPKRNKEKEIVVGFQDQTGQYWHREIPISFVEIYDIECIKKWFDVWRNNYKKEVNDHK